MNAFMLSILVLTSTLVPLVLPIARNLEYEYATLVSYMFVFLPLIVYFIPKMKVPSPREAVVQIGFSAILTLLPALYLYQSGHCLCSENDFRF